eukprot:TRINITY_DN72741_c0_g1_i1.p1 TRINITY_DN72741_c0_g1~~TRINITY_DN72741_c0_g1_i1.p1  ORF type:complete len:196 (-),score=17.99 TRINITY_DN72741_c0_g1_i1:214-780(-)
MPTRPPPLFGGCTIPTAPRRSEGAASSSSTAASSSSNAAASSSSSLASGLSTLRRRFSKDPEIGATSSDAADGKSSSVIKYGTRRPKVSQTCLICNVARRAGQRIPTCPTCVSVMRETLGHKDTERAIDEGHTDRLKQISLRRQCQQTIVAIIAMVLLFCVLGLILFGTSTDEAGRAPIPGGLSNESS